MLVLEINTLLLWVLPKYCRIVGRINLIAEYDFLCPFNNAALLQVFCISASLLMLIINIIIIKEDQGRKEYRGVAWVDANLERSNLEGSFKTWKYVFSLLNICIYFRIIILVTVIGTYLPRLLVSFIVVEIFCLFSVNCWLFKFGFMTEMEFGCWRIERF